MMLQRCTFGHNFPIHWCFKDAVQVFIRQSFVGVRVVKKKLLTVYDSVILKPF